MKPNYNHCIMNLIASIEKHYGYQSDFQSLEVIDKLLIGKKHIFLILLDGLGNVIIKNNLPSSSFIRENQVDVLSSVFPPTTVAATTAVLSNKLPGETGWLGWHQYFTEVDHDIVMFRNEDYYTYEKLDIAVEKILPYECFFSKYKDINTNILFPSFRKDGYLHFSDQVEKMIEISKQTIPSFTYAYWNEPDYSMHEFGCYDEKIKEITKQLSFDLNKLNDNLDNDSLVMVIADHGLIDSEFIYLSEYPDIMACLIKLPSIESRCATFAVKDKKTFTDLFQKYFGKWFELYTKDEFLKSGYLHNKTTKVKPFIFDYVAVAIDKYGFDIFNDPNGFKMRATHAGATYNELEVPLIVFPISRKNGKI